MEPRSAAYKAQMQKKVRNRSYVRVSYGIFNLVATQQAQFADNGHAPYSDLSINDDIVPVKRYITLEKNYWRADGSQYVLPAAGPYDYTGFVSSAVSDSKYNTFSTAPTITVSFSEPQDIYGLTLYFPGGEAPQEIRVNGAAYYPNSDQYVMPDELTGVEQVVIEFVRASKSGRRVRLDRIRFGQSVFFGNGEIIKTNFSSSIDFLSLSLTQKKSSFTIDNRTQVYNPLNPEGLYAYLEAQQPMEIDYGYELDDGSIEWILGDNLVMESTPVIAEAQATFPGVDVLTSLSGTFYHGLYRPAGISLYDLAKEVLDDAGVEHYTIDEHLKAVYTKAALPVTTHKECLQIIANAGQCILYTDRRGYIKLEIALDPAIKVGDNGHVVFSNSTSAFNDMDLPTQKYADFLPDSWRASADDIILPSGGKYMRTGFISDKICGTDGVFADFPVYWWAYSFSYPTYQIPITFDSIDGEYAADFDVIYKLAGAEIDRVSVTGNTAVTYTVEHPVSGVDRVEIEIHRWCRGTRRAVIDQIGSGRINDMNIDFNTATAKPVVEKSSQVKTVTVNCYNYTPAAEETELYHEDVDLNGDITLNISHDAAADIAASLSAGTIVSEAHYTYYSILTLTGSGPATLSVTGHMLATSSVGVVKQINPQGEEKSPLQNPLITDLTNAQNTALWMADYFSKRNFLSTDYRGNPEIDAHDLVYMESQFEPLFPVRLMTHEVDFDGALSGKLKAVMI